MMRPPPVGGKASGAGLRSPTSAARTIGSCLRRSRNAVPGRSCRCDRSPVRVPSRLRAGCDRVTPACGPSGRRVGRDAVSAGSAGRPELRRCRCRLRPGEGAGTQAAQECSHRGAVAIDVQSTSSGGVVVCEMAEVPMGEGFAVGADDEVFFPAQVGRADLGVGTSYEHPQPPGGPVREVDASDKAGFGDRSMSISLQVAQST